MAIIAASYSQNIQLLNKLIYDIKQMKNININHWNQIFVAYLNLLDYDSMWNEYKLMSEFYGIKPNIKTLNILISVNNKQYKKMGLNQVEKYILKYGKKNGMIWNMIN